ncbi:MAG: hypothetical protein EP326_09615 [Deltaproteobacteria bacterium]|nr:MAG: hypothetical protein EP326_09615 [Deltaproteobacteria bacterium]
MMILKSTFLWISMYFFLVSPVAMAKVSASQCVNGMDDLQINRLYEIGVIESRIEEMCKDSALDRDKINQLIMPVKVPSQAQINQCLNDVQKVWDEGKELFEAGLDLSKGVSTIQSQCNTIVSPAQVNDCINKANALIAQTNALSAKGISFNNNLSNTQQQCQTNLSDGDQLLSLPNSLLRRLLSNNKASDLLAQNWPEIVKNWDANGKLPDGISPYFPEEKKALYMLGLDDEDLQYVPPRGIQGSGEEWAKNNLDKAMSAKKGTMAGLAITYLNLLLVALFSPFHLFSCWSRPSVHAFVASSAVYLGLELSLIKKYKTLISKIRALTANTKTGNKDEKKMAALAQVDRTLEDIEDIQGFVDGISEDADGVQQDVEELKKACETAVNDFQSAQSSPPSNQTAAENTIKSLSQKVDECVDEARALGVTAEELLAKGLEAINILKKAGNNAVDQLKLLKYVRSAMEVVEEILKRKSTAAFIYGGGLTAAGTLATLESMDIYTWGKCEGGGAPSPGEQIFGGLALTAGTFATGVTALKVKEILDNMGIGDTGPLIGVTAGAVVLLIGSIYLWFAKSKLAGIMRAVFFGVVAALGFTAGALIKKTQNLMKSYVGQMTIIINAFEKTLNNEGFYDDGKEWSAPKPGEHNDYYDPSSNQVSPDGAQTIPVPTMTALPTFTPIPTITPLPTLPPGLTVPPGFTVPPVPTVPPGVTIPPGATVPPGFTVPPTPTFPSSVTPTIPVPAPTATGSSYISRDEVQRIASGVLKLMEALEPIVDAEAAARIAPNNCYTGKTGLYADPKCSCLRTKSCKQAEMLLPKPSKYIKMDTLKGTTTALVSMKRYADAVYNGNHHMQKVYSKQLLSFEPRLKQENKFVEQVWNGLRKQNKAGQVNFELRKQNMMSSMQTALKNGLNQISAADRKTLMAKSAADETTRESLARYTDQNDFDVEGTLKNMKNLQASLGKHKDRTFKGVPKKKRIRDRRRDSQKGLDLSFDVEEDKPIHEEQHLSKDEMDSLSEFEGDDIEKDSSKSIWKIISKRYIYRFRQQVLQD